MVWFPSMHMMSETISPGMLTFSPIVAPARSAIDRINCVICAVSGRSYRVLGNKGKQVRDKIHSFDLVEAFVEFIRAPRRGEVYNIGGSRHSNCSMLEAIDLCEEISGRKLTWSYEETNRAGDHIWWISDVRKL